jgi:hypothetical protein
MYQVEDPGHTPVRREVAVSKGEPSKGSFVVLFRPLPWVRWRALLQAVLDAEATQAQLTELAERLLAEAPDSAEAIEALAVRKAATALARERGQLAQNRALSELVAWGVAGHEEIVQPDGTPYPVVTRPEHHLGQSFEVLAPETLALYLRLKLLPTLAGYVMSFQAGTLPETLEGFHADPSQARA